VLYYTFLESTGLADRYQRVVPTCIYAIEGTDASNRQRFLLDKNRIAS
jgi:hypothetical protein